MKRILLTVLLSCSALLTIGQKFELKQPFFLICPDDLWKLEVRQDTVIQMHCYYGFVCQDNRKEQHVVEKYDVHQDYHVLVLRKLNTALPLSETGMLKNIYWALVLKEVSPGELRMIFETTSYATVAEVAYNKIDYSQKLEYVLYTQNRMQQMNKLRNVQDMTAADFEKVKSAIKKQGDAGIAERFKNTHTGDLYATGFARQLLTQALLQVGYNPAVGPEVVNKLLSDFTSR